MAYTVRYDEMQALINEIKSVADVIDECNSMLRSVYRNMNISESSMMSIYKQIREIGLKNDNISSSVKKAALNLYSIKEIYYIAEQNVYCKINDIEEFEDFWDSILGKSIGKFELGGNIFKVFVKFFSACAGFINKGIYDYDGKDYYGNVVAVLKDGNSAGKNLVKIQEIINNGMKLKDIGLTAVKAYCPMATWPGIIKDNLSKSFLNKLEKYTEWKGSSSIFAWAGVVLSGIENSIKNFSEEKDEYGENLSFNRAFKETFLETTIDLSKDIVIGAAVSAVVGGAGVVGVPALVVGALSIAGINYGLDKVSQWVTGDNNADFTETISDFTLNSIEFLNDGAQYIAEETISTLKQGVARLWGKLSGAVQVLT